MDRVRVLARKLVRELFRVLVRELVRVLARELVRVLAGELVRELFRVLARVLARESARLCLDQNTPPPSLSQNQAPTPLRTPTQCLKSLTQRSTPLLTRSTKHLRPSWRS